MSTGALDPLIHDPERLRIIATLAALPVGDALSVTRLRAMLKLTPDRQLTRLRELGHGGYVRTGKTGVDGAQTSVSLTSEGRRALDHYIAALRQLPPVTKVTNVPQVAGPDIQAPASHVRVSDADRDRAVAALGEHFAQGRLTLDELNARLDATLTARTYGELSRVARDLPDLAALSIRVASSASPERPRPGISTRS